MSRQRLSIADGMNHYGIGGAGNADWLAGYQDNLVSNPGPITADNEIFHYVDKLIHILWCCLASWYYTIIQAHLIAGALIRA